MAQQAQAANQTDEPNSVSAGVHEQVTIDRVVAAGPWPAKIGEDPGNELSGAPWAEEIGKQLFSDASLSSNGEVSCATCHQESLGFTDGLTVAQGIGKHVRNTQGLLNSGLQSWFGWDGGTDSLWAASLRPLLSDIEMGGSVADLASKLQAHPTFLETLSAHLPSLPAQNEFDDESLVVLAAKSIGAYLRTLSSTDTAFDAYRNALEQGDQMALTNYPVSAKRGLEIFFGDANCWVCHFGPNFSNGEFHDIGMPFFTGVGQVDPGRYTGIDRVTSDRYNLQGPFNKIKREADIRKTRSVKQFQSHFGQWRTPSLRNLTLTAPYMHDGSLATLREVVNFYADIDVTRLHAKGESILKPLDLDESSREDLVMFLESLSPPK